MEKNKIHNSIDAIKGTPFMHMHDFIKKAEQKNSVGSNELSTEEYALFTKEEPTPNEKSSVRTELRIKNAEFQAIRYLQNNSKEITFLSLRKATTMFMRIIDRRKTYQLN